MCFSAMDQDEKRPAEAYRSDPLAAYAADRSGATQWFVMTAPDGIPVYIAVARFEPVLDRINEDEFVGLARPDGREVFIRSLGTTKVAGKPVNAKALFGAIDINEMRVPPGAKPTDAQSLPADLEPIARGVYIAKSDLGRVVS